MMSVDDALPIFIAEAAELLREMELGLLECTGGTPSNDNVNRVFRCAHTIKGSAGLFGLDAIVAFVHSVEAILDCVRMGQVALEAELISVLLSCRDHIETLVGAADGNPAEFDPMLKSRGDELLGALAAFYPATRVAQVASPEQGGGRSGATARVAADVPENGSDSSALVATDSWHISLRFGPDVLTAGMDPMAFLRYLNKFGAIRSLVVLDDALPAAGDLDPEKCHLGFEFAFDTQESRERIEGAFEFVREDSTLRLVAPHSPAAEYFHELRRTGLADERIAQILQQCGSLTPGEIEAALQPCAEPETPQRRASDPGWSGSRPAAPTQAASRESRTIRVDADKLDYLITRIGELITAAAAANLTARRSGNTELQECTANVAALIEQVREGSLQLRMVKIGGTFARFQRIVHDMSRELGKEIELVVSGEDTELDKTLVERITDPLTHLVRNSIDHGIEAAEVRAAGGKPAVGSIKLNAFHDSGAIVIEVSDDGGGLRRDRILAKALERGLIAAGQILSDAEILNLVFEPGFSTAEKVTNLSGRGVGMDVVKRNITALRGDVSIKSTEGVGTTTTVRLPLTLAIINGFQVAVGKSVFVLPLEAIEECVEFSAVPGHDFTSLRGEVLPFIRLQSLFSTAPSTTRRQSIVVVRNAGQRAGLVVDALLGEFQTVIKPLGKIFERLDCVSGSSILGTGEVALILDVPALVRRGAERLQQPHAI
jgi:two-component system chemotaxis sensor kinase CheA